MIFDVFFNIFYPSLWLSSSVPASRFRLYDTRVTCPNYVSILFSIQSTKCQSNCAVKHQLCVIRERTVVS